MKFVWNDKNADIGNYHLYLIDDNGRELEDISITDYTCDFHQQYDPKNRYLRPYSFEVSCCNIFEGFDYDKNYESHVDENGRRIGGYQGTCTHTLEDIRAWCENFIAQMYLKAYDQALNTLETKRQRAQWFESQGFTLEENKEEEFER